MLQEELKDPRIGFVHHGSPSNTGLASSKVFVSVYDEANEREASVRALKVQQVYQARAWPGAQNSLCSQLDFVLDDGLDRAQRLEDVMSAIMPVNMSYPRSVRLNF